MFRVINFTYLLRYVAIATTGLSILAYVGTVSYALLVGQYLA